MKKFLSLLLTLAMVFALVACGNNTTTTNNNSGDDQNNADNTGTTGEMPDSIKIGVMGTMTGEMALDGDNIKGAIAVVEKELEEAGGLQVGDKLVQVEFVQGDTEGKPEQAVNVMQRMINQEGVVAVLGPNPSSDCCAAYEIS